MNPHLPGAGSLQQEMQPFNLQPQQERAGTLWIGVSPIIRWFHKGFVTTLTISCNPEGNELGSSVVFVCRICLTLLMRLSYTGFLSVSSPLIRSLLRSLSRLYAGSPGFSHSKTVASFGLAIFRDFIRHCMFYNPDLELLTQQQEAW